MKEKLGIKRIYIKGQGYYERCVWKDESNDTYWIRWYYEEVRVLPKDPYNENAEDGWKSVREYK